jgi:CDP-diacylglycerol---glycerol-3-phosphate 3-phosphatidyltransferase
VKPLPFRLRELGYPSNLLTLLRLLMLPFCLACLRRPERRRQALICLGLAMLTDAFDGTIARHRNETSRLGEILDPIADKIVIDATALVLSQTRHFPWWATGLLLFRDIGILASASLVLRRSARVTTARLSGKATTAGLSLAMLLYIADGPRSGRPALYLAMLPFAVSFLEYGAQFLRIMTAGNDRELQEEG